MRKALFRWYWTREILRETDPDLLDGAWEWFLNKFHVEAA